MRDEHSSASNAQVPIGFGVSHTRSNTKPNITCECGDYELEKLGHRFGCPAAPAVGPEQPKRVAKFTDDDLEALGFDVSDKTTTPLPGHGDDCGTEPCAECFTDAVADSTTNIVRCIRCPEHAGGAGQCGACAYFEGLRDAEARIERIIEDWRCNGAPFEHDEVDDLLAAIRGGDDA